MFTFLARNVFEIDGRSMDSEEMSRSVNIRNDTLIRLTRMATYGNHNHTLQNSHKKYGAVTFLLPISSMIVLTVVILLMVLFDRCPQLVAAIVAGILGTIIIFTILMSVEHPAVYE